jgi:electron transfer flavoprotein alpha subunit
MRIAVLVKQVPKFEEMELGADGRLVRDGIELEMNPYCRRAVAQAVALAEQHDGTRVTVFTLGPPPAEDTLREAIAWGLDRNVDIDGVLVTDRAFAGSDTLATAKAVAAALTREGPFDLVLTGRNSVDADTGQVPAEAAELLELPFLTGVRHLALEDHTAHARCEHDDGWVQADVELPAMISCAERLIDPAKVDPPGRAAVPAERIRTLTATDLGAGPWGDDASPTWVGPVKVMEVVRACSFRFDDDTDAQVAHALAVLDERGALRAETTAPVAPVAESQFRTSCVVVVCEPDRAHTTRELLGEAARLTGNVTAVTLEPPDAKTLVAWGANEIVHLDGENVEEDVAAALVALIEDDQMPSIVLAGSTAWGREVASRIAARIDAGLVGDAMELDIDGDQLTAWKPAFGGQLVAAVGFRWGRQLVTVRPGVLPVRTPRPSFEGEFLYETRPIERRSRVNILARTREDDLDILADAHTVIGVGQGVGPDEYAQLDPLKNVLHAELGATRKVTDKGWLPRSRQIGITGRAIAPRLFVSIGASGKFNHTVGVRAAQTVLAINPDRDAPIWQHADTGICGDWHEIVPRLVAQLRG